MKKTSEFLEYTLSVRKMMMHGSIEDLKKCIDALNEASILHKEISELCNNQRNVLCLEWMDRIINKKEKE